MVIKIAEEGYVGGPYFLEVTSVRARANESERERERRLKALAFVSLVSLTQKNSVRARARAVYARVLSRTHDDSPIFHVTLFARTWTRSAGYHYPWHKMERKSI